MDCGVKCCHYSYEVDFHKIVKEGLISGQLFMCAVNHYRSEIKTIWEDKTDDGDGCLSLQK